MRRGLAAPVTVRGCDEARDALDQGPGQRECGRTGGQPRFRVRGPRPTELSTECRSPWGPAFPLRDAPDG